MPHHEILIPTPDGTATGSLHVPQGSGPWPGVLMLPDAGGLRASFRDMGDHLAGLGYVTLVPDVYYRDEGWAPFEMATVNTDEPERARITALMHGLTADKAVRDARAYCAFLRERPETTDGPIGVTGYCMGGRLALIVAGHLGDSIAAVASFHGGHLGSATDPESPHRRADAISAEVYVAGATGDPTFPDEQRDRLEQALADAGVTHVVETYAGAHGFAVPDHPGFDVPSSDRHWQALADLFGRSLPAG